MFAHCDEYADQPESASLVDALLRSKIDMEICVTRDLFSAGLLWVMSHLACHYLKGILRKKLVEIVSLSPVSLLPVQ